MKSTGKKRTVFWGSRISRNRHMINDRRCIGEVSSIATIPSRDVCVCCLTNNILHDIKAYMSQTVKPYLFFHVLPLDRKPQHCLVVLLLRILAFDRGPLATRPRRRIWNIIHGGFHHFLSVVSPCSAGFIPMSEEIIG